MMRSQGSPLRRRLAELRARLQLSTVALRALLAAAIAVVVSVTLLGGVTDDVTEHNGLARTDPAHLHWFTNLRSDTTVSIARLLTDVGTVGVLVVIAVLAVVLLWRSGSRMVVAFAPAIALGIGGLCAAIGKSVVGRARPPVPLHLVTETDASFPSGHATDSTALFLTLALVVALYVLRRPVARLLCFAAGAILSIAIGTSRLVLGVHWPTDVLAGWAVGFTVALVVTVAVYFSAVLVPPSGDPEQRRYLRWIYAFVSAQRGSGSVTETRPPRATPRPLAP
jgi:membrane-associated phospholipid phosphatase